MKKVFLLLMSVLIFSAMVTESFSLYTSTVNVNSSVISTKVFDISQTLTVADSEFIENTPDWMFTAFNTAAISDYDYDTNIQIQITPGQSTAGLQAGVYSLDNTQLAISSFVGDTAVLVLKNQFVSGVVDYKQMKLAYFYNGQPISTDNIPFAAQTVRASVTCWGTPTSLQQIIDNVLVNRWYSVYLKPKFPNKTDVWAYLKVPVPGAISPARNYNNSQTGTINIVFDKPAATLTIYRNNQVSYQYTNIDTSVYVGPNAIVIQNLNSDAGNYTQITSLNLNGIIYAGPYLNSMSEQVRLFRNFVPNADGSFTISFDYTSIGSQSDFSINVGYE